MARTVKDQVLEILRGSEGLTNDEMEAAIGGTHQTVSPRVHELAQAGRVVDTGKRRRSRSGKPAIVWRVAEQAIAARPIRTTWKKGFGQLVALTLTIIKTHVPKAKQRQNYAAEIRAIISRVERK